MIGGARNARGIRKRRRFKKEIPFAQIFVRSGVGGSGVHGILRPMLEPTLPDLSKLDREALQALVLSKHDWYHSFYADRPDLVEKLQRVTGERNGYPEEPACAGNMRG